MKALIYSLVSGLGFAAFLYGLCKIGVYGETGGDE